MSTMMLKADAESECIRRWRNLPKHERSTNEQAVTASPRA